MDRIKQLASHFAPAASSKGRDALLRNKTPEDVVVVYARRSALTKARNGGFSATRSDELLTAMLKVRLTTAPSLPHKLPRLPCNTRA